MVTWAAQTLADVKAYKGDLIAAYATERLRFMRTLKTRATFGRGWQQRVTTVMAQARQLIRGSLVDAAVSIAPAKASPKDQSITETLKRPEAWTPVGGLLQASLPALARFCGRLQLSWSALLPPVLII